MRRTSALAIVLAVFAVLAVLVLVEVVATVFLALTVAYVAQPLYEALVDRGVHAHLASAITTALVFVVALVAFLPLAVVLYVRRGEIVELLESLPEDTTISASGFTYVVDTGDVFDFLVDGLQAVAIVGAGAAPALALEFSLFVFLVFGLLLGKDQGRAALVAIVPTQYHDVVDALEERARATLWGIYVLQAATALATFAIAVPVFFALGYEFFVTLAVAAAVLQFLPVVGPSLLILGLVAFQASTGDVVGALLVGLIGGALVAWLPDIAIRPRLAKETANLPGSLYFVGFVGGLLSVGVVGIIAGPLIVALVDETVSLLAAERRTEATRLENGG